MNPASVLQCLRLAAALAASAGIALRAAEVTPAPVPAKPAAGSEVVQLEKFTVTTSLGSYAETTSSAATKVPVNLKEVSSTLQVINAAFIEDVRAKELDDIYPYVVGMTRQLKTSTGFTLRGFSALGASQASAQVDGLPGLATRFGSPTTANIERVEVLKGPTSVLYGQNNPGGLINLVTKRPQLKRAAALTFSLASYAGENSSLGDDLGTIVKFDSTGALDEAKHWLYRTIISYEETDTFRRNSYFKNYYVFPSLTFRWSDRSFLLLQGDYTRQKRRADDGLVAPFSNLANVARFDLVYQEKNDVERDSGEGLSALFQHEFAGRWTFKATTRTIWHTDTRLALENGSITNATPVQNSTHRRRYRDNFNGRRFNFADANLYGNFGEGAVRHTLLFGASYGREYSDISRRNFTQVGVAASNVYNPLFGPVVPPPPPAGQSQTVTNYDNYGAYVSDQLTIGKRWHATAGFRSDRQDSDSFETFTRRASTQSVDATVPNLGVVFDATPNVSAYASYVRGFKPASVNSYDAQGNNGFPAEKSAQIEVGLKSDFLDGKLTATLALYKIEKSNVVENTGATLPSGNAISQIFGGQRSKGVELQVAWLPVPHWQLLLGATSLDPRVTKSLTVASLNAQLAGSARYSGSFWTRYNIPQGALRGLGFGLGSNYTAKRHGATSNSPATQLRIPPNTRVDVATYYRWQRYDLALNLTNALDRHYISTANSNVAVVPGDPRKLMLTVGVAF